LVLKLLFDLPIHHADRAVLIDNQYPMGRRFYGDLKLRLRGCPVVRDRLQSIAQPGDFSHCLAHLDFLFIRRPLASAAGLDIHGQIPRNTAVEPWSILLADGSSLGISATGRW
jgi:hypothetical protein